MMSKTKVATGFAAFHTLRTFVRLVISIGLTAALNQIVGGGIGVPASVAIVGGIHTVLTFVQNFLEARGVSPQLFKSILNLTVGYIEKWFGATPNKAKTDYKVVSFNKQ